MNDIKAKATHIYTTDQSSTINEALRNNDKSFIRNNKDLFCAIDGYIDEHVLKDGKRVIVYRGHGATWNIIQKLWPAEGEFVRSTNYTSTSWEKECAEDLHSSEGAPIIEIKIPKGVGLKLIGNVKAVSRYPKENEGVIKPYATFKILKKTKKKIILELQPSDTDDNNAPYVRI